MRYETVLLGSLDASPPRSAIVVLLLLASLLLVCNLFQTTRGPWTETKGIEINGSKVGLAYSSPFIGTHNCHKHLNLYHVSLL